VLIPWLMYGAVIFYFSSQSRFFLQPPDFFSADKFYHFLEYAILGLLTARVALTYGSRWSPGRRLTWSVLFCLLYALGDEFHQWFVPGRWASWGDVLADTLGGWAGAQIYALWARSETRNRLG
jgi:VanZ family protein